MNLLFLQGINDSGRGRIVIDSRGRPRLHYDGSCNVHPMTHFNGVNTISLTLYGGNTRQPRLSFKAKPDLIFNQISDPDSHAIALKRARVLCDWAEAPVINHPNRVESTTRDGIARRLSGIPGVIMPRTVRFEADSPDEVMETASAVGLEPPFIVRIAGDHGGKSMVAVMDPGKSENLHVFPFGRKTFYLTEFVDYGDEAGRYHKQRIVFVAGEPIARHAISGNHWNVHAASRKDEGDGGQGEPELERTLRVQRDLIPRARKALDEIARRVQLDYFGLDCHLHPDGRVLVFEANANMNMLYNKFPALEERLALIRDRLCALISERLSHTVTWEPGDP